MPPLWSIYRGITSKRRGHNLGSSQQNHQRFLRLQDWLVRLRVVLAVKVPRESFTLLGVIREVDQLKIVSLSVSFCSNKVPTNRENNSTCRRGALAARGGGTSSKLRRSAKLEQVPAIRSTVTQLTLTREGQQRRTCSSLN